jgi:hypothetical protein
MKAYIVNKIVMACAIGLAIFVLMFMVMQPKELIIFLNGLLAGAMVALLAAFLPFVKAALLNDGPYDRGRQFGLGSFLMSLSISIGLATSIYIHTNDLDTELYIATAFARWMAIWGAVLKITSPDFGAGILYGRTRKTLWIAVTIGVLISVSVIALQDAGI